LSMPVLSSAISIPSLTGNACVDVLRYSNNYVGEVLSLGDIVELSTGPPRKSEVRLFGVTYCISRESALGHLVKNAVPLVDGLRVSRGHGYLALKRFIRDQNDEFARVWAICQVVDCVFHCRRLVLSASAVYVHLSQERLEGREVVAECERLVYHWTVLYRSECNHAYTVVAPRSR